MLMSSRKRDSWSSKSSKKSSRKRDIPDNEDTEFDLGLWKQLSEELLREAAAIPLPGHDGKDGIETEDDEVEVPDGVAVTEEAVETGTADIIINFTHYLFGHVRKKGLQAKKGDEPRSSFDRDPTSRHYYKALCFTLRNPLPKTPPSEEVLQSEILPKGTPPETSTTHQSQDETSGHAPSSSSSLPNHLAITEKARDILSEKLPSLKPLHRTPNVYLSQSNNHIHHFNRLLSSTPTLDLILSTTSYTLALISTLVPSSLSPNPSIRSHLLRHRLSSLSSLLSETRTTLRLFGLIPIYTWAVSTFQTSQPNTNTTNNPLSNPLSNPENLTHSLTLTQILAGITFQILENLAYLGDKNILPLSPARRSKYWLWCCRAWAVHVFLEIFKLLLSRPQIFQEPQIPPTDSTNAEKSSSDATQPASTPPQQQTTTKTERETYHRNLKINLAYAPMTLHYSFPNGLLNDSTVALCGVLASWWGLQGAWARMAER
ncbi:MAG: hypothetical protein Q9204_007326 [Flavoplaca sp. TL-2023a]